ncbi:MAG: alanine/ornithine racemase family PLP-dependent enzyme [Firmicutes bacterium]|nr:alanine/ornithine racemase family PLP-dependent enzyme [Bacillota bacterium]
MFPTIEINEKKLLENVVKVNELAKSKNIKLSVVTKLLAGNYELVDKIVKSGVKCICDSRIDNLKLYENIDVEKWLIRLPMVSEVSDVIKYSDASLNTELITIKALNEEAIKQKKIHNVIFMYELGDLREGCLFEELNYMIEETKKMSNINIYGIGNNLSCYGEIVPTKQNMEEFSNVVRMLEEKHNIKFEIVSGGNSSSYNMMKNGKLPSCINNVRLGESIFLGNVPCFEEKIEELHNDCFILKTQIIELKEKPSLPWGERGVCNSFSESVTFVDRGIRKRAIIALGKQDVRIEGLKPIDDKIIILDGSSDHIIIDVSDSLNKYDVGDIISFNLNYAAVLSLMNSKDYVKRKLV